MLVRRIWYTYYKNYEYIPVNQTEWNSYTYLKNAHSLEEIRNLNMYQ